MKNNLQTNQNYTQLFHTDELEIAFDIISGTDAHAHRQILFLINGFQRTRHDFRAFRQKITRENSRLTTIAFDNRYCGETRVSTDVHDQKTNNISLLDFANDTLHLLKHCMDLFQPKTVHVLGISMGGMIAQILASLPNCPRLQSLFLVSTTAGGQNRAWPTHPFFHKKSSDTDSDAINFEDHFAFYFGEKFLKTSPLLFKMFVQNIKKSSQNEQNNQNARLQEYASKNFEGIQNFSSLNANNIIIISGDEDHIMPVKNSEILHKLIPNSELIVYPGIGHLILIENSNKFVHDVCHYLNVDS